MIDDQTPISSTSPSKRFTRGPTRLRRLSLRRASGKNTPVNIDVNTKVTPGLSVDTFNSYLGVVARERISILTNSWDDVIEVDRNML